MIFTTRDLDILRFLRWCRFVLAKDLTGVFSKGEVQNLEILRLIKLYQPAQAYTLTAAGNRLLDAAFPKLPAAVAPAYKAADTLRRIRQAKLMTTAYQAGVSVFTTDVSALCEQAMFLPMIARTRGFNPWGSTRVAALVHTGDGPLGKPRYRLRCADGRADRVPESYGGNSRKAARHDFCRVQLRGDPCRTGWCTG